MKEKNTHLLAEKFISHHLIIIALFILGLLVYYRSLECVFLFDDIALILDNPLIKKFSYIKDIFKTHLYYGSGTYSNFYRPIQSLSYMFDYYIWGLKPFGYHLTNTALHIINSICVYFLCYKISKKQDAGIIAGLLYCVHTVLSGTVYYIASRADTLSSTFFLLAMLFYLLYKDSDINNKYAVFFYLFSLTSFILALLSKEISIILPLVLMLYLFYQDKYRVKNKRPGLIWIFFIIAILYALLRATLLNFTEGKLIETTTAPIPLYNRLLTTAKVLMIYLRLLFVPIGLHMEWNIEPARSFLQDEVFLSVFGLFVIGFFGYFLFRSSKEKFFAFSWFFITLLPYSNIFPLAYFMGEGWLYLPSAGFFMLVALYFSELRRKSRLWSNVFTLLIISIVLSYGILTFKRADVWANPVNLYREVLKYSPNNIKARINLGVALRQLGSEEEALKMYSEASKLKPNDASTHSNLGTLYANKQMYDMALEEFKKAVEIDPGDCVAHNNLGILYKQKGDIKKAMEEYNKALELNPNYILTYNNIGNIYLDSGNYDEAIRFYKKAISLDPNKAAVYANLGRAYKNKGMSIQARESFEKALQLDPNNKSVEEELKTIK